MTTIWKGSRTHRKSLVFPGRSTSQNSGRRKVTPRRSEARPPRLHSKGAAVANREGDHHETRARYPANSRHPDRLSWGLPALPRKPDATPARLGLFTRAFPDYHRRGPYRIGRSPPHRALARSLAGAPDRRRGGQGRKAGRCDAGRDGPIPQGRLHRGYSNLGGPVCVYIRARFPSLRTGYLVLTCHRHVGLWCPLATAYRPWRVSLHTRDRAAVHAGSRHAHTGYLKPD